MEGIFMNKDMPIIVDANIFLEGLNPFASSEDFILMTSPEIEYEIRSHGGGTMLDLAIEAGLRICSPGEDSITRIENAALETGDDLRLSFPDKTILALALQEHGAVFSDDYSVQNVAAMLGIEVVKGLQDGINEVFRWRQRCRGCKRFVEEETKGRECPVCGSEIVVVRDRR